MREIFRPTFKNHLNYKVALNNGVCFYHIKIWPLINIKGLYYICRLLYEKVVNETLIFINIRKDINHILACSNFHRILMCRQISSVCIMF